MGDSGPSDSQVGDDPSTFDDEGVGYGNVDTTTEQFQEDTRQENQRSNIIGDPNYDAQFTADRIENQFGEGTAKNFMSSDTYAQTTQAARDSGLPSVSIDIPSIQAASSNLAPGILGETLSDFQSGVRQDTPANQMLEAAIGTTARIPNVSRETVVDNRVPGINEQLLSGLRTTLGNVQDADRINKQMQDALVFGGINPDDTLSARRVDDPRFIDFGVVDRRAPGTGVSTVGDDFSPALDMVDARTQDTSIVGDDFGPALDMIDARTTATGTNLPEDYEENVGRAFLPERMADIERLYNLSVGQTGEGTGKDPNFMDSSKGTDPAFFEGLGIPGPLASFGDKAEMLTREQMATDIALGRPRSAFEMLKGFTATPAESIEEFNKRMDTIPENQLVRNNSGRVIGIKDADGRLVTGMDPDARVQATSDGGEQVRRAPPKAATDPCPEGYQLIDGKCTPTGATDTGTGFMMFPADRDPAFRRGPFTPTTVATNPNIRALNPVTFGLSNIFRR